MKRKIISALVLSTAFALPLAALAAQGDSPMARDRAPANSGTLPGDEGAARADGGVPNPDTATTNKRAMERDNKVEKRSAPAAREPRPDKDDATGNGGVAQDKKSD